MQEEGRENPDVGTHKYIVKCQTFPSALKTKIIPSLASAFSDPQKR